MLIKSPSWRCPGRRLARYPLVMMSRTPAIDSQTPIHCTRDKRSPRYTRAPSATMTGVATWRSTTFVAVV
jgi:hypothetical protein